MPVDLRQGLPQFDFSGAPDDPDLQQVSQVLYPSAPKRNVLSAGLSAGGDQLLGLGGAAVSAAGKLVGVDSVAGWGADVAQSRMAAAERNGRPDLDVAPWELGISQLPSWLGYQAAKTAPTMAALMAGGAALAPFVPGAVGAGMAGRVGASLPTWVGGGGLRAGMTAAEQAAARAAGAELATSAAATTAAGMPIATGSMYQEALERGDADRTDAARAFALSPFYSALDALQPAGLTQVAKRGIAQAAAGDGVGEIVKQVGKRVGLGMAGGAITETPTEALQTALEKTFRPDQDWGEKAHEILNSAITGGAVGGLFGGVAGLRRAKAKQQSDDILQEINGNKAIGPDGQQLALPPPTMYVTPQGDATTNQPLAEQVIHAQNWVGNPLTADQRQQLVQQAFEAPAESAEGQLRFGDAFGFAPQMRDVEQAPTPTAQSAQAVNETQLPLDFKAPTLEEKTAKAIAEERLRQREFVDTLAPDAPKGIRAQFRADDELGVLEKALERKDRKGDAGTLANMILEAKGLHEDPKAVQARAEQAAQVLRSNASTEEKVAAKETLTKAIGALELWQKLDARKAKPAPKASEAAPAMQAIAEKQPDNTLMQEKLTPAKKAIEAGIAEQQAAEQKARSQNFDAIEAALAAAERQPLAEAKVESGGASLRSAAKKTLEGVNRLTDDQLQSILSREEFANDPNPAQALVDHITNTKPVAQVGLRKTLAQYAGTNTDIFTKPKAVQPKIAPAAPAPVERVPTITVTPQAQALTQAAQSIQAKKQPVAKPAPEAVPDMASVPNAQTVAQQFQPAPEPATQGDPITEAVQSLRARQAKRTIVREYDENNQPVAQSNVSKAQQLKQKATKQPVTAVETAIPNRWENEFGHAVENVRSVEAGGKSPNWHSTVQRMLDSVADDLKVPRPKLHIHSTGVEAMYSPEHNAITLREDLGQGYAINHALHEMGHHIKVHAFETASRADQQIIVKAYKAELKETTNQTVRQARPLTTDINNPRANELAETNYHKNFDEWFAEGFSRWATTNERPRTTLERALDRVFSKIVQLWDKMYERAFGYKPARAELAEFLNKRIDAPPTAYSENTTNLRGRLFASDDANTIAGANNLTQRAMGVANTIRESLRDGKYADAFQATKLAITTTGHIAQEFANKFSKNLLKNYYESVKLREAVSQRWAGLVVRPNTLHDQLERRSKVMSDKVSELMRAKFQGHNLELPYSENTWLHKEPNQDILEKHHTEGQKLLREIKRVTAKSLGLDFSPYDLYKQYQDVNKATYDAGHVLRLRSLAKAIPAAGGVMRSMQTDPMERFMHEADIHETPKTAAEFWRKEREKLLEEIDSLETSVDAKKSEANALSDLYKAAAAVKRAAEVADQSPYFHLGRTGNYFVKFRIRTDKNNPKIADEAARAKIEEALANAGITEYELAEGSTNPQVFLRMDDLSTQKNILKVMQKLDEDGLLQKRYKENEEPIASFSHGERSEIDKVASNDVALKRAIEQIKSKFGAAETEEQQRYNSIMIAQLEKAWLNMMPDIANAKVMETRKFVGGNTRDTRWAQAHRMQVAAHSLANAYATPKILDHFGGMIGDIREVRNTMDADRSHTMQQVYNELAKREAQRATTEHSRFVDALRALNHTFFLAMSPSYVAIQFTQLPVLLWPQLAKNTGYVGAAKAMSEVTPKAFAAMKEVFKDAWKAGPRGIPDINITADMLLRAGFSQHETNLIMRMVARNMIDFGSAARELGRIEAGKNDKTTDLMLRYGSMAGLYAETTTRLIAALSAAKLYKGDPNGLDDYVANTIEQSMFNYNSSNTARAFGRNGIAGKVTPIGTAFLHYNFMLMEKLYRELHAGFMGGAQSEEEKTAARRFLAGHMTAVMVLAGSLGLPGAALMARVIDGMADALGDDKEPYDVQREWRRFLASTLGPEVGEVLSRGMPRALGIDIANRVGEQNIIPFTKLLTDRRRWDEALKDWAWQIDGAPLSMIASILAGMGEIANGNVLHGMKMMVPVALKGPIEAGRMWSEGYVDRYGKVLPMTPSARDIFVQALGFQPAQKGEYYEKQQAESNRKIVLDRQASGIRRGLIEAIEAGDRDSTRQWLEKAREFDAAVPHRAILPKIEAQLRQRAQDRATASALNVPLGVKKTDITGIQKLQF